MNIMNKVYHRYACKSNMREGMIFVRMHIIAFASVTFANKAGALLNRAGYPAAVKRTPSNVYSGCGYSVVSSAPVEELIKILENNKIPYKSISELK